ncbi:MAG: phosphatase PAP2 family protein [Bacteroidales bacterium]|nr:phosphatase PAP2 family protein [Bacteroidales bacterium]
MLEQLDKQLFLYLNSFNSPFWDRAMSIISGIATWIPLYLVIMAMLAVKYRKKFFILLIFIIIAVTLSDQLSVLIKNIVLRLRPCYEPSLEGLVHNVNGRCGGKYSFVSSHATNSFNVAVLSLLLIRKRWFSAGIILWAAVVGYSRIYLGVHYPGDVLGGASLGMLIGWSVYNMYYRADRYLVRRNKYLSAKKSNSNAPE